MPELFPAQSPAVAEVGKQAAALNAATVPTELKAAVQFQKTYLKILAAKENKGSKASSPEPDWVNELRAFVAADRENDPVVHGVADVARAWLARVEMRSIDAALRQYYRRNVRFPEQFSAVEASLAEGLRRDPWGEAWSYQPCAPEGLAKLAGQRYRIGPARFPDLGTLEEAAGGKQTVPPAWKISLRNIGGKRTLEFRLDGSFVTVEAGGVAGPSARLLYIGEGWALMAGRDQLFAVTF